MLAALFSQTSCRRITMVTLIGLKSWVSFADSSDYPEIPVIGVFKQQCQHRASPSSPALHLHNLESRLTFVSFSYYRSTTPTRFTSSVDLYSTFASFSLFLSVLTHCHLFFYTPLTSSHYSIINTFSANSFA